MTQKKDISENGYISNQVYLKKLWLHP